MLVKIKFLGWYCYLETKSETRPFLEIWLPNGALEMFYLVKIQLQDHCYSVRVVTHH